MPFDFSVPGYNKGFEIVYTFLKKRYVFLTQSNKLITSISQSQDELYYTDYNLNLPTSCQDKVIFTLKTQTGQCCNDQLMTKKDAYSCLDATPEYSGRKIGWDTKKD